MPRPFRMTVLAYDMGCPRRARRVRKALEPWRFDKQYSVYETRLGHGEFRGVLAELADCCDFAADRLAVWWPFEGLRLVWRQDRLQVGAREGVASRGLVRLPARIGNFVVCYDVTDPRGPGGRRRHRGGRDGDAAAFGVLAARPGGPFRVTHGPLRPSTWASAISSGPIPWAGITNFGKSGRERRPSCPSPPIIGEHHER
jgi:CRISPR/Cas system-associated endoribonuclease Cas2